MGQNLEHQADQLDDKANILGRETSVCEKRRQGEKTELVRDTTERGFAGADRALALAIVLCDLHIPAPSLLLLLSSFLQLEMPAGGDGKKDAASCVTSDPLAPQLALRARPTAEPAGPLAARRDPAVGA